MADSAAISAHGTLVKRNGQTIAELRNITPPALTRNSIETTMQTSSFDSFVVGVKRRGELQFQLGFLPSAEATHNALTGLIKAWSDGSKDLYELDFPDASVWTFSGYVTNIASSAPVDGGLEATVSIRPTNAMTIS
jgi:tail tube protein